MRGGNGIIRCDNVIMEAVSVECPPCPSHLPAKSLVAVPPDDRNTWNHAAERLR